jgi:hypothetical protein
MCVEQAQVRPYDVISILRDPRYKDDPRFKLDNEHPDHALNADGTIMIGCSTTIDHKKEYWVGIFRAHEDRNNPAIQFEHRYTSLDEANAFIATLGRLTGLRCVTNSSFKPA